MKKDLGKRWVPALLNSHAEFLVLRRIFGNQNNWIGGSSDYLDQNPLAFSNYTTDYSGINMPSNNLLIQLTLYFLNV